MFTDRHKIILIIFNMVAIQQRMEKYIFDNCRYVPKSIGQPLQSPRKPLSHEHHVPGDGWFWKSTVATCRQWSVIRTLVENTT